METARFYDIDLTNHPTNHSNPPRKNNTMDKIILFFSTLLVILTFPILAWYYIHNVKYYERVVIFRFGKIRRTCTEISGSFILLPFVDTCHTIDIRTRYHIMSKWNVYTKDHIPTTVRGIVRYRIENPIDYTLQTEKAETLVEQMCPIITTKIITQIDANELTELEDEQILEAFNTAILPLGIKCFGLELCIQTPDQIVQEDIHPFEEEMLEENIPCENIGTL